MWSPSRSLLLLCCSTIACSDPTAVTGSASPRGAVVLTPVASAGGVELAVNGGGHVLRNLGDGDELTTFSYSAIRGADGTTTGEFQYDFRAANLIVHGYVTCLTSAGNIAWIGGVIDRLQSEDPADQELVGTDIWWRVTDNGEGAADAPDQTTSLLFTIAGVPITAQSWCNDQPTRGVQRPITHGNIQIRTS
jgi:hypothetical protein